MGMSLIDRSAIENIVIAQLGVPPASIFNTTSNLLPRVWWVAPGGYDGIGNGYMTAPFLTIKRAIRQAVDYDIIIVAPGSYAETLDIGSGDATSGSSSTNGYAKKGLKIIGGGVGLGYGHNGLVQIVGDGSTAAATVKVRTDYLAGFLLKNLEVDTSGVTQPAVHLITSNTASGSQSNPSMRGAVVNVAVRSNDPDVGLLLEGTTSLDCEDLLFEGPNVGIGMVGSGNNNPVDLSFKRTRFNNSDMGGSPLANVATLASASNRGVIGGVPLAGVVFQGVSFEDSVVTNFIDLTGSTTVGCAFYDCRFPKAPTNGTNGVATLPTNCVVLGHGTSGLVSLKG